MCGIFAYIGQKQATQLCLEGLKKLEYRGYDSAGIAGAHEGAIVVCKEQGKVSVVEKLCNAQDLHLSSAIAHTRWATHGIPSKVNAHPHLDQKGQIAVVHNGVIENYAAIKKKLIEDRNIKFVSETDTEVIPQLAAAYYSGDFFEAVTLACQDLEGSFAIVFIHKDFPDEMIAVAEKSPLVIGYNPISHEIYVASDPNALADQSLEFFFLENRQMAHLIKDAIPRFFDKYGHCIQKEKAANLHLVYSAFSKGIYEHFMLKEIFEQDHTLAQAFKDRIDLRENSISFEESNLDLMHLASVEEIILVGCGTSFHAGSIASYFFEQISGIATRTEIASEYRYKPSILSQKTLVIALSQSGETADTLAAMKNIQENGCKVLALCNVEGSTLARQADYVIFLRAGPEIAVASTKTFTSQIVILFLLALLLGRQKGYPESKIEVCLQSLVALPKQVDHILHNHRKIQKVALKYAKAKDFYFLGRGILYPVALEAALKLKEIAYVNAVGYAAGEMKHGPIALLQSSVPVGVFCAHRSLEQKIMSNLMESKARGSPIIVFGLEELSKDFIQEADDVVLIPNTTDELSCILATIVSQLFAYYIAKERGVDIDRPLNLAKSVTVE